MKRICAIIILLTAFSYAQQNPTVYIETGNLYEDWFKEPFEKLYFVFKDGTVMAFSTHHAHTVDVNITWIIDRIRTEGREIADILLIVHNHFAYPKF